MSDDAKPKFFERLSALLHSEPENRTELLEVLREAHTRQVLDADTLAMAEGLLAMSGMTVREVMIPRAQMDALSIDSTPQACLPTVLATRHSRFPVIGDDLDDVRGILLAKDLLRAVTDPAAQLSLADIMREAVFVPESKPLNILLKEFRVNRNHMAIVVDEFGGVAGLVTIEDVLEQIVGDIADEHDSDNANDQIITESANRYRVQAQTPIADFNERLKAELPVESVDTIGGLVLQGFGRLPKRNETIALHGYRFSVLRADNRRLHVLLVEPL
jgi:magnesium and cobalt transporter